MTQSTIQLLVGVPARKLNSHTYAPILALGGHRKPRTIARLALGAPENTKRKKREMWQTGGQWEKEKPKYLEGKNNV